MEVINSVVGSITTYILGPIGAKFRILRNLRENIGDLEKTTGKLNARSKDEQARIEEAKREQRVKASEEANLWFSHVSKAVSDTNNLKAEYDDQTSGEACTPNCFCCSWSRYKLSKRALKLKQDVDKLYNEDPRSSWTVALPTQRGKKIDTVPIEGQPTTIELKREIIDAVVDDRYVVVGLYGMGGVGKTTLLQHANEHFRQTNDFESVIFTTVSATPNFVHIRKQIAQSLGLTNCKDDNDVKERLSSILQKRKYLLILDDMWDPPVDIGEICIPAPKKEDGCKILMASRSLSVVTRFVISFATKASLKSIPVNSLPQDEAWKLFVQKVGEDITSKPGIEPLAKEVLRKCGGLPLAIIVIGGTMSTRETEGEWKDAVRELEQHSASNLEGMDKVFSILMFSFEKLEPIQQSLFLYCCLFPEDSSIGKERFFHFAIGEETLLSGMMHNYKLGDVRNRVDVLVGKLRNSSMLEDASGDGNVKMHDVMREMGLWITSPTTSTSSNKYLQYYLTNKFIAKPCARLTKAPDASEWHKATRISLMDNDLMESLPDQLPHSCLQLHTLLLRGCKRIMEIPQVHFLDHMPALGILDLSCTGVKYLPPSISYLVNLRLLRLSFCRELQELPPEIGMLLQLKCLDLFYCEYLRKVPVEMKKLENLRRLDIRMTSRLKSMPCGVLSGLLMLEELDARGSGLQLYNPNYVQEWSQLTRLTSIEIPIIRAVTVSHWLKPVAKWVPFLDINDCAIDPSICLPDLLEDSPDFDRHVSFTSCKGLTSVPTRGCKRLSIEGCPDLKSLMIVDHQEEVKIINAFESLCRLELHQLNQLETICSGVYPQQPGRRYGCFSNLEFIRIEECPNLKELFTKGVTRLLKKLRELHVFRCSRLVKLISDDEEDDLSVEITTSDDDVDAIFPSLEEVYLCELPKLRAICHLDLKWPSLSTAHVYLCPNVRRPPFGAQRADILLNDESDSQMTIMYQKNRWIRYMTRERIMKLPSSMGG